MFCTDDPIKNNLTWLSDDNVDTYINRQADLADSYPHAGSQANSIGNLFILIAFLCLIVVMFIFISKAGII